MLLAIGVCAGFFLIALAIVLNAQDQRPDFGSDDAREASGRYADARMGAGWHKNRR